MRLPVYLILFSFLLLTNFSKVLAQQTDKNAVPELIFMDGQAQIVPEFNDEDEWIKEELWVETTFDSDNDGELDRMHVYVTRPHQTASGKLKLPVIYQSSPYYGLKISTMLRHGLKLFTKKYFWDVEHEIGETPKMHKHSKLKARTKRPMLSPASDKKWVPRGYITVYSSSPGTGLSDGAITVGGKNESLAPKAVIDWLCGRAKGYKTRDGDEEVRAFWSSGKVGMTGTSYDGTLCIAAATTGVEGLEAIIPVAPISSYYDYYRSNGLVRSPGGYLGEDMDVLYDFVNTGDKSKRDYCNTVIRDSILVPGQDRATGDYNDFWDSRNYLNKIDSMQAALLMAHGFNDWNVMPIHSYQFYKAAKEKGLPTQLYYHQSGHGGDPPMKMMNRWFTRYLHGVENEVEDDAPVRIVRGYNNYPNSYDNYPASNASDVILHLKSGDNNTGILTLEKPPQQTKDTLVDDYSVEQKEMLGSKYSSHRLLFVSPTLKKSIRISGIPKVTIRLASNEPVANLSVYLIAISEREGKTRQKLITRGWADPQNRNSIRTSEPLTPGEFVDVSFDLMPDDQVILPGNKIALMIFSSDQDFTLCPEAGTKLIIDPNKTRISIPVLGGKSIYSNSLE